jgi:DNA-directed RNA polymerase specialized sigma24 family protein
MVAIASQVLGELDPRDSEVLVRYYLMEERGEQIQETLGITSAQFRLLKSRAKARFAKICQNRFGTFGPQTATSIWTNQPSNSAA